jgi:hypothetical protein
VRERKESAKPTSRVVSSQRRSKQRTDPIPKVEAIPESVMTVAITSMPIVDETQELYRLEQQLLNLQNSNKKINVPAFPANCNTVALRREHLEIQRRAVKILRLRKKNRRWFVLGTVIFESWMTYILGVDLSGLLEDVLDEMSEYDEILYDITEELTPRGVGGPKPSPWVSLTYSVGGSVLILGILNFVAGWVRSYNPMVASAIPVGRNLLKKLIKDADGIDDDEGLVKILSLVDTVKGLGLENIVKNPQAMGMLSNLFSTMGAKPVEQPTQVPAPSSWSSPSTATTTPNVHYMG